MGVCRHFSGGTPAEMSTDQDSSQFWRDQARSDSNFLENWRIRTGSDWENCCSNVIIPKITNILVVMRFHVFARWWRVFCHQLQKLCWGYFVIRTRDEWTVKFFSPSPVQPSDKIESDPVLIRKIFENHQSDPVLIRPCKIMHFYFASWSKSTTGAILPLAKYDWLKTKKFQECLCVMRQNRPSLLSFPKFDKAVSIFPPETKALLELFCY